MNHDEHDKDHDEEGAHGRDGDPVTLAISCRAPTLAAAMADLRARAEGLGRSIGTVRGHRAPDGLCEVSAMLLDPVPCPGCTAPLERTDGEGEPCHGCMDGPQIAWRCTECGHYCDACAKK